jgi:hypothetical protein
MGKPALPPPQPGAYRDDPDRDDAASTSSAVLMGDIDYPDEALPAYTDAPESGGFDDPETPSASGAAPTSRRFTRYYNQ